MDKISPFHIKNFRKQTGLSQKHFAQAVDLPTRTYRSYETGERGLTIDKFRELKKKNLVTIKIAIKQSSGSNRLFTIDLS